MIAAATSLENTAPRRAWTPDAKDHLVYSWIKFEGKTQGWAACQLGISQSTVSRIVDRYERWQAHVDPREGGRLDPAERLRAQRWLTYERNELILASALRIADRMEGVTELSKSVRTRPLSQWHKEGTEIRSEEQSVDRHGVAARFLRLAFRINMEQLKLVQQESPAVPEPLSAEQLEAEAAADAAIAAEFQAAEERSQAQAEEEARRPLVGRGSPDPALEATEGLPAVLGEETCGQGMCGVGRPAHNEEEERVERESRPETEADMQPVHNLHNRIGSESGASANAACTCAADACLEKNAEDACIADQEEWADTNPTRQRGSERGATPAEEALAYGSG